MTAAQLLTDQAKVFTDFPTETLTYLGRSITCVVMSDDLNREIEDGGFIDDGSIILRAERSQFADIPAPLEGTLGCAFRSKSYRLGAVTTEDAGGSYKLTLVTEAK